MSLSASELARLLEARATQQQGFVDDLCEAAVLLRAGRFQRPTLGEWLEMNQRGERGLLERDEN
jgi:hypothetical protein